MKKGTKTAVFIISMSLIVACLFAFVGKRHCDDGVMYNHGTYESQSQ